MRQVLFYVSLDQPFSISLEGTKVLPILHVGLLFVLLLVFGLYAFWLWKFPGSREKDKEGNPSALNSQLKAMGLQIAVLGIIAWALAPTFSYEVFNQEVLKHYDPDTVIVVPAEEGDAERFFVPERSFPVYGYGMMLLIALVSAASWAGTRAVQVGFRKELIWDVAMLILVSGIVGARAFFLIQKREQVFTNAHTMQEVLYKIVNLTDGGLVLYGGVILATIVYFSFCWYREVRPIELADVVVPSVFLGLGFGRIGCLLNGCCYGDRCDLPWAITFPAGSVPHSALVNLGYLSPDSLASFPLHPSQIYSSIGGFLLAFITAMVFKYRRRRGEVLAVAAIFYPINRFLIEFVRGDEFTVLNTGLTPSQNVSVLVMLVAIGYLIWLEFYGVDVSEPGRHELKPTA